MLRAWPELSRVESLSPHRVLGVDEDDESIDIRKEDSTAYGAKQSHPQMILENLKTAAGGNRRIKPDRPDYLRPPSPHRPANWSDYGIPLRRSPS